MDGGQGAGQPGSSPQFLEGQIGLFSQQRPQLVLMAGDNAGLASRAMMLRADVAEAAAQAGLFNVFLGEFNFSDLPEADLMRSIRLFGELVIPALRDYEPG